MYDTLMKKNVEVGVKGITNSEQEGILLHRDFAKGIAITYFQNKNNALVFLGSFEPDPLHLIFQ